MPERTARPGWAASATFAAALILALPASAELQISFVQPRHLGIALGPTTIQLFVTAQSSEVSRIEVQADGRLLAVLSQPPWTVAWDAGDGSKGHTLAAVAHLKDGREARATIQTSPLRVDQYETVDLVNLYVVVRDGGRYVTDLQRSDFRILEKGVPQSIDRFVATHKPLRIAIVLDTSLSMEKQERLVRAKEAALDFLKILQPGDEGLVVTFNDTVQVSQELSADKEELAAAIREAKPSGGTALYDAVWRSARLIEGFDGRRVMVLLSDGRDESSSGFEPGSLHTLDEALEQSLRSEVMIFPIGLGHNLDEEYIRRWRPNGLSTVDTSTSLASVLQRLGESTGGRSVTSTSPSKLREAFDEIANDLRHQYSIAYTPTDTDYDGRWRPIEVTTPGRALEVITRKGYYAADRREKPAGR
jgi:VWFA-related protein